MAIVTVYANGLAFKKLRSITTLIQVFLVLNSSLVSFLNVYAHGDYFSVNSLNFMRV